jgi:hypothetical protein
MSFKIIEMKDQDGNILVSPFVDVSSDPSFKAVITLDQDGNKTATPVIVINESGGGGGSADISGLVRNLTSAGANVTVNETLNTDGTKNYEIIVDGITQAELDSRLSIYSTKAETVSDITTLTPDTVTLSTQNVGEGKFQKRINVDAYNKSQTDAKLSQKAFVVDTYSQIVAGSGVGVVDGVAADGSKTATLSVNNVPQRVVTLSEIGVTETLVSGLANKPSGTIDAQRRSSLKDFIFLIHDNLSQDEVLIDQISQSTRPEAFKYLQQIVDLQGFKTNKITSETIELIITNKKFEINGDNGPFAKNIYGGILRSGNAIKILDFKNMTPFDLIWDDGAALAQRTRFLNYINAISWYKPDQNVTLRIGTTTSNNIYKDCNDLYNNPAGYNSGYIISFRSTAQNTSSANYPTHFKLSSVDADAGKYHELEFSTSIWDGSKFIPLNRAMAGYVRYQKLISTQTINNGTTFRLTDLMEPVNRDQNNVLGAKSSTGVFTLLGSTLENGLFYINHNRRVKIEAQLRLDINLGSVQALTVMIRRGDGTLVDTNIGTLIRTPDTTKTTTNIVTFSSGLTDAFVTSGFEFVIVNNSGANITLPAQTFSIDFNVIYY